MSEQAPQYHPVVEEMIVTSGPDAGRIKGHDEGIALAMAVAEEEAAQREVGKVIVEAGVQDAKTSQEKRGEIMHKFLVSKLADVAFRQDAGTGMPIHIAKARYGIVIGSDLNRINEADIEEDKRDTAA